MQVELQWGNVTVRFHTHEKWDQSSFLNSLALRKLER